MLLLLFSSSLAVIAFFVLAVYGFANGDPSRFDTKPENDLQAVSDVFKEFLPLVRGRYKLASIFVATVVFAIAWIQCLRFFGGFFIKGTIYGGIIGVLLLAVILNRSATDPGAVYFSYGLMIIALIFVLMVFFFRSRIEFTVLLFKQGTAALSNSKGSLFIGMGLIVMFLIVTVFYLISTAFILSMTGIGDTCPTGVEVPCEPAMKLWYLFSFLALWICFFISGLCQTTISGAISSYLYNQSTSGILSLIRALHAFGSIALASLIIALVTALRIIVQVLKNKALSKSDDLKVKILFCLIECCVRCIESFVKWFTGYMYIFIAKDGSSFCQSARATAEMMGHEALTICVSNSIAGFVLAIGKLLGVGFATAVAYWLLSVEPSAIMFGVTIIVSYMIMSITCRLIMMSVETCLVCFYCDESIVLEEAELADALRGYQTSSF
ncbi:hypothetical protein GEMRC1_007594 [Eukaryota sp. GEM-RC1]